ncbi:MAG: AAA family ATPase, partial [Bifidobacterium sp.]|nr:AAA family ATPase [Bifidobacterium sp.]
MESTAIPQRPIAALLDDPACAPLFSAKQAAEGTAVLVAGAPRTGKTSLAVAAAERGMDALGGERVVLAVPNRVLADEISPRLIRHAGVSVQARPATTLNALAFRLVTAQRARAGQPLPRLLNGAEQDALLRRTLGAHLAHVRAGDDCATCRLLRDYFANERWMRFVSDDFDGAAAEDASDGGAMTTEALLDAGINAAFTAQLRDMLARLDELGVGAEREDALIAAVADSGLEGDRLRIQWRLAFALRCEYIATISRAYPHEYRLDSSYLPVAAAAAVRALDGDDLPALVIVDDFQDTTLAGFALLETLRARGTRLLLTGNPDEAVQTFRGSYPETLFDRARTRLEARPLTLPAAAIPDDFLRTLASRVSLSIAATRADDTARPERPGKMPALPDAWPIRTMAAGDPRRADGTVAGQLYRSAGEELENVLWQVKTAHLQRGVAWNDMGVILHDNAQVRRFGERLRDGGVPVRYSSVTRPLAEEPFVQALFALIELAQLRNDGLERRSMTLAQAAAFVRSRVRMVVASPLLEEARGTELPHPMAMEPIDAAMRSLQSLATIGARPAQAAADGTGDDADTADSAAPSDSAQAADREAAPDTALAELAA